MYDPLCSHLADELDALVVSVDYRLAPEHRAPTAAHDAIDATRWLVEDGDRDHDRSRIAVCGDSAGGNLAAVVAQELRDLAHELTDGAVVEGVAIDSPDGRDILADEPSFQAEGVSALSTAVYRVARRA